MRKGDETGEHLYRRLDEVPKQVQHWGLDVRRMYKMEHYKSAKLSPAMHNQKFGFAAYDEYIKQYPPNLDSALIRAFMDGDAHVLANHAESISNAAKRDDAEFFISLSELLIKRKGNRIFTSGMFAGPKSIPDLVNQLWMSGCLWLMTDTAALTFLNIIFNENIRLPSYRKARTRPKKLVRHPESPIRKIQWPPKLAIRQSKPPSDANHFCAPVLKKGWSISDGCLIYCGK